MKLSRCVFAGTAVLALVSMLFVLNRGDAGGEEKLAKAVDDVAAALAKGDTAGANKLAKDIAQKEGEIYYVMLLMKPRDKKGFGVGSKANEIIPDGIELKLRGMDRDLMSKQKLEKEAADLIKMTQRTAAIALISQQDAILKNHSKEKSVWENFAKEMQTGSHDLAKAVQGGSPAEVKTAAGKLNANCNNCHSKFR